MAKITLKRLKSYRKLKYDLVSLQESIKECELLSSAISAVNFKNDRVIGGCIADKTASAVISLDILKVRLMRKVEEVAQCLNDILIALETVKDSQHRRAVKLYYIDGMTIERIEEEMHISYKTFFRYRKKALIDMGLE